MSKRTLLVIYKGLNRMTLIIKIVVQIHTENSVLTCKDRGHHLNDLVFRVVFHISRNNLYGLSKRLTNVVKCGGSRDTLSRSTKYKRGLTK